jgi:hypothetical protein
MNNELEVYGMKQPCPNLRYHLGIYLEGLRKTMKISFRVAGLWARICNWSFLNDVKIHISLSSIDFA